MVSKDEDFSDLSVMRGCPPKVVWLQIGNCTTRQLEARFRSRIADIEAFAEDSSASVLVLS
ncbi:MAG: hypothetical protein U1E05_21130 [Patescibacteria group bacterium]|nr:hypothetical protein [Patescibacteria group bacterium]